MKIIGLIALALLVQGCSYATIKLIYSDAKVVYEDAHYVVHEIKEAREKK